MSAPNGAIPVEALLKLTLDKAGSQPIQDFLDKQEHSWGRIEQTVSRLSGHIEGMGRFAAGLAGVAGVGAVVQNFMATSQAGSNLALAAGHVTGGPGTWHPYGQALLGAQSQTGVAATDIAQGLIMAVQATGGNPTPQQAAILGGLLAGYGQTVGLSPAQVAQAVAPLLQASGKSLNSGNLLGLGSAMSGTLTAFPGSQAGPMLGLVSQLGVAQALGSGPAHGFSTDPHGLAAIVNASAMTNSIFRNPGIAGGAASSISGGLQGAFGNPSMEAFLQRAGISYQAQRQGITPANAEAIMREATSLYGTGITRDLALRSMFGLQGADMLEALSTPQGHAHLRQSLAHHGSTGGLLNQIHHAQQRTTPRALGNRFGGDILHWLEASPLHALLGLAGITLGPGLARSGLSKGAGAAARGLGRLFGGGASEEAGGSTIADILGSGGMRFLGAGVGTVAGMLAFPDSTSSEGYGNAGIAEHRAVASVLNEAYRRFGPHALKSGAARNWMEAQIYGGSNLSLWGANNDATHRGMYRGGAGHLLDQVLGDPYGRHTAAGQDPVDVFAQAAKDLKQAADMFLHGPQLRSSPTSYNPGGSSMPVSWLGAAGVQALGAAAPGMEFAALTGGGGGALPAAFGGGSGASIPAAFRSSGGGGGQSCTLTWYDPALGGINGTGTYADGGQYRASDMACAAPPQYPFGTQIQFSYGGRSITCSVRDRGGAITGTHFDLTRGAFQALGSLSHGVLHATYKVVGSAPTSHSGGPGGSSGGGQGVSAAGDPGAGAVGAAMASAGAPGGGVPGGGGSPGMGGGMAVVQPVVHVYVDGRELRNTRVVKGHHHK